MSLRTPSESWEAWTRPVKRILAFFGGLVVLALVVAFSTPLEQHTRVKPPTPAPKPEPRVYVATIVDHVCRTLLREQVATECYADRNFFSEAHWMVVYGLFLASEAPTICQRIARSTYDLARKANANPVREWQVRIHTPYTGAHPIATCWMYR